MSLFCALFCSVQAIGLPGAIILSVWAGVVFPLYIAILLVCCCSTIGSLAAYFIYGYLCEYVYSSGKSEKSYLKEYLGSSLVKAYRHITSSDWHLFWCLLGLRLHPLTPNWAVNIVCGCTGAPCLIFISTTFLGLFPHNCYLCALGSRIIAIVQSQQDPLDAFEGKKRRG